MTTENFDVYLEPLVEELLQLWEGIPAYDIRAEVGERDFTLRGMLLWTIYDFPGYGTVGGFSHQGFAACPWCGCKFGCGALGGVEKANIWWHSEVASRKTQVPVGGDERFVRWNSRGSS